MYAEWILGAVVKAQLILLTASNFRRGKSRWVVVAKMKIEKKMFLGSIFTYQFFQNNHIDVKKMRGIQKKWFQSSIETANDSKMMFYGKNYLFS